MSALYLLAIKKVICIQRGVPNVLARLSELGAQCVALSSIVVAELAHGVEKSAHKARCRKVLKSFLSEVRVLPWMKDAMWRFTRPTPVLQSSGQIIGGLDVSMDSHALAADAACVTKNTREFEQIQGLKLENWVNPVGAS